MVSNSAVIIDDISNKLKELQDYASRLLYLAKRFGKNIKGLENDLHAGRRRRYKEKVFRIKWFESLNKDQQTLFKDTAESMMKQWETSLTQKDASLLARASDLIERVDRSYCQHVQSQHFQATYPSNISKQHF
jgi:hypothetical protein